MSRSRKKRPVTGVTTSDSEKEYKTIVHRKERRATRQILNVTSDDSDPRLHPRPYHNPWNAPKDGKIDWTGHERMEEKARRK